MEKLRLRKSNIKIYGLFITVISVAALILNWQFLGGLGVGALLGLWKLRRLEPSFFQRTDSPQRSEATAEDP